MITTEWTTRGYFGRIDCACCGFAMIGENRTLHIRSIAPVSGRELSLCDGCVNEIAKAADGNLHYADGSVRAASLKERVA